MRHAYRKIFPLILTGLLTLAACGDDEETPPPAGNNSAANNNPANNNPANNNPANNNPVNNNPVNNNPVNNEPGCMPAAPVCAGEGPRSGCAADEVCNTQCQCEPEGCQADAPVCEGSGPNNGCAANQLCNSQCTCEALPAPSAFLTRPSRSTAIDVSADDRRVVMVNTDDGSLSVFDMTTGSETRTGRVATSRQGSGSEPMAVVLHPDGVRAFVANRGAGTVSVVEGLGGTPQLGEEIAVGAEPIGLALTPSGNRLFVTDWVGGTVSVVNTRTMAIEEVIEVGGNPYAVAVTNDGDEDDRDERVLVTQFYGQARAAAAQAEGTDDGKEGIVHVISADTLREEGDITLAPIARCFENAVAMSGCYPNQLYGIAIHTAFGQTRAYVTSVAASPGGPVNFSHNVQAVVHVIDLATEQEVPSLTVNLNTLVKAQVDEDGDPTQGRRFVNVPVGIDFVPRGDVAFGYVASSGSDLVMRVEYTEEGSVQIGAPARLNIPVGQSPQGIVVKNGVQGNGAYVGNLISRDVSLVDFRDQVEVKRVESTTRPASGSPGFAVWQGKRFFNTSTGIWSNEGWGSCQSCHPHGLTDNVTFKFAAGPRQSVSLDGQYASDDPSDMRALNWTAIFDETHDFELNTRGVSGGRGTLQGPSGPIVSPSGPPFAAITVGGGEVVENHQALNGSLRFIANDPTTCTNGNTCPDFDLMDAYIQSIRSPRGKRAEASAVARGRAVFEEGGCDKCHGGPKWTVSRTFYDPTEFTGELGSRVFATNAAAMLPMDPTDLTTLPAGTNTDTTLVAGDDSDGGMPALKRQACNIRSVGTFGAEGGADETRDNGTPAQGRKGFNPPSLLGLATGAPYLHNGAASSLRDLFSARFNDHTRAGSVNFRPTDAQLDDLIVFLLAIDEDTAPFPVLANTVLCPTE